MPQPIPTARLEVSERGDGITVLKVIGDWLSGPALPSFVGIRKQLEEKGGQRIEWDASQLGAWNTGLLNLVLQCREFCQSRQIEFAPDQLPEGLRRLIRLATSVPEKRDAVRATVHVQWIARVGEATLHGFAAIQHALAFLGESVLAFWAWIRGDAQFRWSDVLWVMQACGPQALGIVALINFLVGLILAFVGAVQLTQFGASIYVADLVAIGTVREMGCMMTAIIVCGRTGAAFAAQLGTMKVNEELDAFRTFGISPMEFLVLPRLIALVLMMPLLVGFANVISILGGFLVSISMLDVTPAVYIDRTLEAISLAGFLLGIAKGGVFGIVVALSGCLRGMECGTNAAAVGEAATSAVVTGITLIIALDGLFAVLCNALKI